MRRAALILVVVLLALSLVAAGCGASSESAADTEATTEAADTAATAEGCRDVEAPAKREDGGATAPTERLDPERTYELVFETSCGSFTVTLDLETAPATSASLVSLAKAGFFDDTIFHRIVPDFVIQGGDPTQSGAGGPGYKTVDVPPTDASYTKGVVAMAKAGPEAPGTAGSQFFVVTGDDVGLPPEYAVVGKVTSGLEAVEQIGEFGVPGDPVGTPTKIVVVESVTVEEQ